MGRILALTGGVGGAKPWSSTEATGVSLHETSATTEVSGAAFEASAALLRASENMIGRGALDDGGVAGAASGLRTPPLFPF
mgnify:CR=1 FL=1